MSYLIEKWSRQLGTDGAQEALRRHPEIAQMSIPEQEVLLQSLERLHEPRDVPVTVENSEELYRHYFADEAPPERHFRVPKGQGAEADFLQNATAAKLKAYFLAKG